MKCCFLLSLAFIAALPVLAAPTKCKGNPKVVAACYSVHGRLSIGADSVRLYLWPIGTKRMLGVTAGPRIDDADDPIWPRTLIPMTMFMVTSRFVPLRRSERARCNWSALSQLPTLW